MIQIHVLAKIDHLGALVGLIRSYVLLIARDKPSYKAYL